MEKMPDYSSKRFLIADDESFMLGMVERMLKQCNAGTILKATDGGMALRSIARSFTPVDCIIADFNMKPINGLQLLQGIRLGLNPEIPRDQAFIMLTGNGDTDVVRVAIALDVHGYVVKPVAPDKLIQTIDKVFRRPLEVKDADHYRSIKLPETHSPLGDGKSERVPAWTILSTAKPFKTQADIEQKVEQLKREHAISDGIEAAKIKNRRECRVDELREGQILARDIEAQEGAVLLRMGTQLTKGMIARLQELAADTNPDQSVWIGELVD